MGIAEQVNRFDESLWMQELLISPKRLKDANIPVTKMVQYPGEMVINYPGAYHSGFNAGQSPHMELLCFAVKTALLW